jgi:holliday junction DNA helicase RuvB
MAGVFPTEVDESAHRGSSGCRRKPQEKHMERNEINDVAPTSLAHLIGQRSVVEQVRVAVDAAQMDGLPFPSTLCCGPSGTGKSQVSKVIAAEMCSDFHEVLGQAS